jgi:threonine synthase
MKKSDFQSNSSKFSFISHLVCSNCGKVHSSKEIYNFCTACLAPLTSEYDLIQVKELIDRDEISNRPKGMWRWHELLPVYDQKNCISLGEGDTALLGISNLGKRLGLPFLLVKDESTNPTGSFKARGLAAAISKAIELGIKKVIIPTAGNAGGAMAAYAARAGIKALIYMPIDTPLANIEESRITGAEVVLVDGLISDAAKKVGEKVQAEGWFDLSTFKEPYRLEGKKIMGYELAESFGWTLPDVIIYPAGGGTGLVGMWKAFLEMKSLGWLENERFPRMVAVQSTGCAPIVKAFQEHAASCEFWKGAQTIASGLRVPKSFADKLILQDLYESNGTAVSVTDESILAAQNDMGREEGIFCAPEGAATLAALYILLKEGWLKKEERIVLFNTGSGLKYLHHQES